MQTFLPYPDFVRSLSCLDFRRLGKQVVEARQIHAVICRVRAGEINVGWRHHPAVLMWFDNISALALYHNIAKKIWVSYGYVSRLPGLPIESPCEMPSWLGDKRIHASHRSNLLRKNFGYYSVFGWTEPPDLPYVWPTQCRKGILITNIKPQQETK